MANESHLTILMESVSGWNKWRAENPALKPDLTRSDLVETNLSRANLSEANLSKANFARANLAWADLSRAKLYDAKLYGTNFYGANLTGADFCRSNLYGANLSRADLARINFSYSSMHCTIFGSIDLSEAEGLDTVVHKGPPTIGIDSIFRSKGKIPEIFLRGAGVPGRFITYMRSLVVNR